MAINSSVCAVLGDAGVQPHVIWILEGKKYPAGFGQSGQIFCEMEHEILNLTDTI